MCLLFVLLFKSENNKKERKERFVAVMTAVPVEFVPEMSPQLPGREGERPITEPAEVVACAKGVLAAQMQAVKESFAVAVTPEKVAEISRYAREKAVPVLPEGWLGSVQLAPLCLDENDKEVVVFGNKTKDGFNLPSHVPGIVFRKLVVRVYVSTKNKAVAKVVVSIRGWCEE